MRRWIVAAVFAVGCTACGIKGPPKPPTEAVAPPPPNSASQIPMNLNELAAPDAGCATCRLKEGTQ